MPPRRRARAKAPAPQEPPVETATIRPRPGYEPGLCLQSPLFFASETWADTIRPDVDALLTAFEQAWRAERERGGSRSPFELFRELWEEQGWGKLHLTGILEGPMRKPWGEAVVRGFTERLTASTAPLRQVAALGSLYAFWTTQPSTMEQIFISVDPPTLEYLLTLPDVLAPSLDIPSSLTATEGLPAAPDAEESSEPTSAAPLPSLDLSIIITSLISSDAFFIIPTPVFLFPPLPSNSIREVRRKGADKTTMSLLGAEEEMEALVDGRFGDLPGSDDRSGSPGGRATSQALGGGGDGDWDDEMGWSADLRSLQDDYLKTKSSAFPTTSTAPSASNRNSTPATAIESRVLASAGVLTLSALETAGSGFGADSGVDLGGVDGVEDGETEATRKRRRVELMGLVGAEGGEPKGLKAFEESVEQLGETVVDMEDVDGEV